MDYLRNLGVDKQQVADYENTIKQLRDELAKIKAAEADRAEYWCPLPHVRVLVSLKEDNAQSIRGYLVDPDRDKFIPKRLLYTPMAMFIVFNAEWTVDGKKFDKLPEPGILCIPKDRVSLIQVLPDEVEGVTVEESNTVPNTTSSLTL